MRIRTGTKRWGLALAAAAGLVAVGVTRLEAQGQVTMFDGSTLYRTYCASCHGTGGRGDGPVAQHLKKPPANLTQIAVRNNGVFEAAKVGQFIDGRNVVRPHGPSEMPVWGDAFTRTTTESDEQAVRQKIEALVRYLETLQERPAAK